jgi:hypothetical protein
MTIFIVYSDTVKFTKSHDQYLDPCIQAIFTTEGEAQDYADDLADRMNSGSYAHEEYPYIKSHEVRNTYTQVKCPPIKSEVM